MTKQVRTSPPKSASAGDAGHPRAYPPRIMECVARATDTAPGPLEPPHSAHPGTAGSSRAGPRGIGTAAVATYGRCALGRIDPPRVHQVIKNSGTTTR